MYVGGAVVVYRPDCVGDPVLLTEKLALLLVDGTVEKVG